MSRVVEALLSFFELVVNNPASLIALFGFVVILIGFASSEVWIVALGLLMSTVGIIASVGKR